MAGVAPITAARRSVALLLVAGALALCGGSAPASGRPLVTGVSGTQNEIEPLAFERVQHSGAAMVARNLAWSAVAPANEPADWHPGDPADPNYDWAAVDAWVSNAVEKGRTPLLTVYGAPRWAQRCHSDEALVCDPDPAMLAAFSKAAATRYGGHFLGLPRVRFWQALNEPNLKIFWRPQGRGGKTSARLYRALLNRFYETVKSVHGSNVVLAAGLAPLGTTPPLRFARALLCMTGRRAPRPTRGNCGGGVRFDIFDIHPYTSGSPVHKAPLLDQVEMGDLGELQRLLRAADRAGRISGMYRRTPLWITEFTYSTKPPDPGGLKMAIAARWTSEALYRAWKAGVSHFFWYLLRDDPPDGFSQGGLYFRGASMADDRPKRLLRGFRFPFVAFPRGRGFSLWGRTPTSQAGSVRVEVRTARGWRAVARATAGASGVFGGAVGPRPDIGPRTLVRAVFRGEVSVPFSLKPVADFYQPPFGF
ncbi:MAG: hypothetical protein U0R52_03535 [Solirubrobacterales bacterium]